MSNEFKSPADALKAQGIDAKRGPGGTVVDIHDVWIPPKDHAIGHPRQNDPLDGSMLYDIATRGVQKPLLLWRMGLHRGKMRLGLLAGCRRTNHLIEACRRMKAGEPFDVYADKVATGETEVIPWKEGRQYAPVVFYSGDEKGALLARLDENSEPFKRADSALVLAISVKQLRALSATDEEIMSVMPREVTPEILAALGQWDDLTKAVAARFVEADAPLAILPVIVASAREEQLPTLESVLAAGVKTKMGASRVKNREERKKTTGGTGERIRVQVLRRIVATVEPTETEVDEAAGVMGKARETVAEAHNVILARVFALGARFSSGDLTAVNDLPSRDLKRRVRASLRKEGRAAANEDTDEE